MFRIRHAALLSVMILIPPFLLGCATTSTSSSDVYRESATDVVNRAPNSVSLPPENSASPVIDGMHVRTKADYHFTLAETYSLEGNSTRAIEEYKLTLVYDPSSPQVRLRLAAEYVRQGLVSEAIEQSNAALEIDPKFQDARLLLAGLYSALRMYDDAVKAYERVMREDPENLEAPLFIGALYAEQKKYGEAIPYFERLAKDDSNPNAHVAWYYLGRIRSEENKNQIAKAEAAFKESLKVKPTYGEALLALGQLYETAERRADAIQLYVNYQEKSGPSTAVAEELARLYIENKDYNRAFEQLAIIEATDKSDLNVRARMAFILIEQEKYKEAISRLEEVLALEPTSDKIRYYLGAVYEEVKDYRAAIMHFQNVPTVSSYYKEAVVHASYLFKLLGEYDKAVETVEKGIKETPDQPAFYALYASLLDDTKQYQTAATMLNDAVKRFPDNAQLHFFLGNMQDRLGQHEAVVASMERVLTIEKDHVQALNFLAYTLADKGKKLDEAEKMVRRALQLQPNDGYILDTLGWIQFKRGDVTTAIQTLEAAYKIQPQEPVIAEHLADAYYQGQMPEKAKRLYLRAAELETSGGNIAQAQKIRTKIVSVDRQIQSMEAATPERAPASAKSP